MTDMCKTLPCPKLRVRAVTPCRNIKRFRQMRQYQKILTLEKHGGQ